MGLTNFPHGITSFGIPVYGNGDPGVGKEIHLVTSKVSGADACYDLLDERRVDDTTIYSSLSSACNAMVTGRNDKLLIYPGSHSLSSGLTVSQNMCIFEGTHYGPRMNKRSRIGMSTTFTPLITVSGYGNTFKNLYTMHGTAATDLVGWKIDGARNAFYGVHFGGPMNADQGGHASYIGVDINGTENTFVDSVFGTDTIGRDEASPNVTLAAGTLTYFKDCLFLCNLTDGDPLFFSVENTSGYTWAMFENCRFYAFNENHATAMTKAFDFTGGSSCAMIFDNNCQFVNVTALSLDTEDQYIWLPRTFSSTTDTEGMISVQLAI